MYRYFERKIMKNRGKAFQLIKRDLRHCPIAISRRVFLEQFSFRPLLYIFLLSIKCNIISVK